LEGIPCDAEEAVEGCFCPLDTVEVEGQCVEIATCTNCIDEEGKVYAVSSVNLVFILHILSR